jgi:small subunit ribosomal protein S8e
MGRGFVEPKLGERRAIKLRVRGGGVKLRLLSGDTANVTNPETGETAKVKILGVIENPANRHFVRRNVLTKGAIIDTELGRAKITSRPGQEGVVNAVLLEAKS